MKHIHLFFLSLACLVASQSIMADDTPAAPSAEYVVVNATITPLREEPSEAAEQATQLLFGEVCQVLERRSSWIKVQNLLDGQVGWVSRTMLTSVSDSLIASSLDGPTAVVFTPMATATPVDGGAPLLLTLGTRLPLYADGLFEVLGQQYRIDPACVNLSMQAWNSQLSRSELQEYICSIAHTLLNTSYLWGGKNAMGLDCSGFAQVVYATVGINLLRNAREQATQGELVSSLSDAQPGDLAFFNHADRNPEATKITHVGILLSPTQIIHCASGRVHIDRIDENGIYTARGTKTHHLAVIKRYL